MLIYEVNIEVDESINYKVAGWLTDHIQRVLQCKGFQAAQWFFRLPEDEGKQPEGKTYWTIQYLVQDRESLQSYFKNDAPSLRQEAIDKFGDKYSVSRRVLQLLSVAGNPFAEEAAAATGNS